MPVTAVIAEDEPLLAAELQRQLARLWPDLQIAAVCGDGLSAERQALDLAPDVLFFDIQMPGQTGMDAALNLADSWPERHPARPFPFLVFVTAFDQFAVRAFEAQAVDYLLKPLQPQRLQICIEKLQILHTRRPQTAPDLEAIFRQLSALQALVPTPAQGARAGSATAPEPLTVIQASVGNQIRMVPLADVLLLEASDKYVQVFTAGHDYLIRTPLKELLPQLDPNAFWQVHRGSVVRATAIEAVHRDESGRLSLTMRGLSEQGRPRHVAVSRVWAHRFKAM